MELAGYSCAVVIAKVMQSRWSQLDIAVPSLPPRKCSLDGASRIQLYRRHRQGSVVQMEMAGYGCAVFIAKEVQFTVQIELMDTAARSPSPKQCLLQQNTLHCPLYPFYTGIENEKTNGRLTICCEEPKISCVESTQFDCSKHMYTNE